MSNADLFVPLDAETLDLDIFASTTESATLEDSMAADFASLEGFENLDNLESFDDLFNAFTLADQGEELGGLGLENWQGDRSCLVPPFLREYELLKQNYEGLQQALMQAEQKLTAQERRSRSNDSLIEQQAMEISKNQEYLTQTVAEIQVYREEAKRQQLQVETLAEQAAIGQNRIAELERDCVRLQENAQSSSQVEALNEQIALGQNRIAELERDCVRLQENAQTNGQAVYRLEKQVQELRTRLQRQQRYALQYKTALEQCLANPSINPSSDIAAAIATLMAKSTGIQPWSGQSSEEGVIPIKSIVEHPPNLELAIEETLAVPSLTTLTEEPQPIPIAETVAEIIEPALMSKSLVEESADIEQAPAIPVMAEKLSLPGQRASHLSFSIQPQRIPRKIVDLPHFARQPIPQA